MRRSQVVGLLVVAAAYWASSCRDVPAPEGGILSLSKLLLPSPGVVAGDTMRDSTGLVAPLRVFAFDVAGDTVREFTPNFVALDTGAHLAGALLLGDTPGTSVRLVASAGDVQTRPEVVKVTLAPDTIVAVDSVRHDRVYSLLTGDTVVNSAELNTRVVHRAGATTSPVEAIIVRYTIVHQPPSNASGPSVVLVSGNTVSERDTTDSGGNASRRARLRIAALTSTEPDSAVVDATATYRGETLGTVRFTVIYRIE